MKIIKNLLLVLVIFLLSYFTYPIFILNIEISGNSMNPTYLDGQEGYCSKLIYNLDRYDIVIFNKEDKYIIKRLIGLPNETIQIKDNYFYIDGIKLEEEYISDELRNYTSYGSNETINALLNDGIKLEDDEYFVCGDNRKNSYDCRYYGPISKDIIIGEVFYIKD